MGKVTWTKEEVAFLNTYYSRYTSANLAKMMYKRFKSEKSRDAILGKIHRMGLRKEEGGKGRTTISKKFKNIPVSKYNIKHTMTISDADNTTCRFTTDDPRKAADMGICGKPVFKSGYCESCYPVVFRKVKENE